MPGHGSQTAAEAHTLVAPPHSRPTENTGRPAAAEAAEASRARRTESGQGHSARGTAAPPRPSQLWRERLHTRRLPTRPLYTLTGADSGRRAAPPPERARAVGGGSRSSTQLRPASHTHSGISVAPAARLPYMSLLMARCRDRGVRPARARASAPPAQRGADTPRPRPRRRRRPEHPRRASARPNAGQIYQKHV